MKHLITKNSEEEIRRKYPLGDCLFGWFFRQTEVSASVYEVEGVDLWGRKVSETGVDPEILLTSCVESARKIQQQVEKTFN